MLDVERTFEKIYDRRRGSQEPTDSDALQVAILAGAQIIADAVDAHTWSIRELTRTLFETLGNAKTGAALDSIERIADAIEKRA